MKFFLFGKTTLLAMFLVFFSWINASHAATTGPCVKQGEVCVEGRETRNINGTMVTKDCWRFRSTYRCGDQNPTDYCSAIAQQPECVQTSTSCFERNPDGSCKTERRIYQCSKELNPQPANTTVLSSSYTVTRDDLDTSQCRTFTDNSSCQMAGQRCVEGPETRTINGQQVYRDCWRYEYEYSCVLDAGADYCAPLIQSGCREIGTPQCVQRNSAGTCVAFTHDYVCAGRQPEPPPQNVQFIDSRANVKSDRVNDGNCASLATDPACNLASNVCTAQGTGACIRYSKKTDGSWTCSTYNTGGSSVSPQERANPTVLSFDFNSYIETKPSACQEFNATGVGPRAGGGNTLTGYSCKKELVPQGQTDNIYYFDGSCNEYKRTYACPSDKTLNSCDSLKADPKCKLVKAGCENTVQNRDGTSRCIDNQSQYSCIVRDEERGERQMCEQVRCVGGICQDKEADPNADFGQTIAGLEIARQAAAYQDPEKLTIFNGQNDKCSVKVFGVGNCCKVDTKSGGAASTNAAIALSTGIEVGREVLEVGSEYVYDMLAGNSLQTSFAPIVSFFSRGAEGAASFNPTISAYGFSLGVNTAPSASGFIGDVSILKDIPGGSFFTDIPGLTRASDFTQNIILEVPGYLTGSSTATNLYFSFDPASLAFQVAFQLIMDYLQCDQSEAILAKKRGQGLCHQVGERYCSSKIFGKCVTKKESYCCYNSKLARIIAQQGRPQIGRPFGNPKNADCSGFTVDELEKVDFSKIDMSEFIADIQAKAQDSIRANGADRGGKAMADKVNSYFNQSDYSVKVPLRQGMGSLKDGQGLGEGGNPALGGRGNAKGEQGSVK